MQMDILKAFDDHHAPLFRFAYRLTGSVADAEDIVQACFLELLRPDCNYNPARAPLRTWLFGVVRNQALKRFRQKPVTDLPVIGGGLSPEHEVLRLELEEIVQRGVLALPDQQREVLILAHYEQMPLAEIAGILDIELGAVKSRLQRARVGLRETLAAYAANMERKQ
jgi:RNA polymerase sigma-70 factor (ECF subfamily)